MKLQNKAFLAILVLAHSAIVSAADKGMYPGMLPLGPFDLIPMLNIKEIYSDNIFHDDLNRKASLITQIQGGGEAALRRKFDRYALGYSFLSSQYHSSPADNYVDHYFSSTAHIEMTRRNRFDFKGGVSSAHFMRGTLYSQGVVAAQLSEPDQFHQYNAEMNYRYGRVDAPGNLGLQFGWAQLKFDNNRDRTTPWDRTQFELTPGFYYRLMPKTYLTTEVENNLVKYDNRDSNTQSDTTQFSSVDYIKHRYLLGVTWDQSSKTKGKFRAGYFRQEYTDSDIEGTGGFTWDGRIHWSPLTYSNLSFGLLRDIQPSIGNSDLARQLQVYDIGWTHKWPGRITTRLNTSYQEVDYSEAEQSKSGMSLSFDAKYAMKPWLNFGVNYSYSDFQYNTNNNKSTQNIFMLYINATPQTIGFN